MPPKPKPVSLNVRLTLEEFEYVQAMAERLDVSLSAAVRVAIARSFLHEAGTGEIEVENLPPSLARVAKNVRPGPLAEGEDG